MAGNISSEEGDIGFQIAPMVDVVFVLLLFFMAAAGSQVINKELTVMLPSGGVSSQAEKVPLIIDIFPDGRVQMNNKVYDSLSSRDLPELQAKLAEAVAKFGDKDPVIVRPDPQSRHERIMDVLNAATAAGIKNLSFS